MRKTIFSIALAFSIAAPSFPTDSFAKIPHLGTENIQKIPEIPQSSNAHPDNRHHKMPEARVGMQGSGHGVSGMKCDHKKGVCPHMAATTKCHSMKRCTMIKNCSTNDDPFTAPNLKGAGYEQQYFLTSVSTNAGTERDMEFIRTYPVKPSSIYYAPPERPPSI